MTEALKAYRADPYSYAEARALSEGLGVSEPVAITLVRRGYRTPEQARRFLDADEWHSPLEFDSMAEVSERLLAAVAGGRRITVHGDFDADGVCATAIMVAALRDLGGNCDWLIPDRIADGYGLSEASVHALAQRGCDLILTVDCAITAVDQVRLARELGMEAIVTDHHQPGPELPDCPILHPRLSGYPFAELCGTAVAFKLAQALGESSGGLPGGPDRDLDLVALATVADVVPLLGENRALVRRGLEAARRAQRPGLRALIAASGCEPTRLDASDLAFRLAPRVNAAGRLYRADAGVELFLTDSEERAAAIAGELDRANRERREIEREVSAAALASLRELPGEGDEAPGLVVAGRGWHPGVVGIVASRLVERTLAPVIVVSLDGEGGGKGSGRSVPGFDILAALQACSEHLVSFGGHAAAAGLELREEDLEGFREAFARAAEEGLGTDPPARTERIDAVVGGDGIGLGLAEELERLGPFGAGNPGVSLLVPSARISDVRGMGEGRHSRFSLHSGAHRALAVAFGRSSIPVSQDDPLDVSVRLEVNEWNGSVEPRLVLRELYRLQDAADAEAAEPSHICAGPSPAEWWERFEAALSADPADALTAAATPRPHRREVVRRASGSAASVIAELVSSGGPVLVLTADASRRAALAAGAAGLARFAAASPRIACGRCALEVIEEVGRPRSAGLEMSDYQALALVPDLALAHEHVVLVDPPPDPGLAGALEGSSSEGGFLHPIWRSGDGLSLAVVEEQLGLRSALRSVYRDLRDGEDSGGGYGLAALEGSGPHRRSPELAARCAGVLVELGLVRIEGTGADRRLGVVSSDGTELERSAAFRAYGARHEEAKRYLESLRHP